jgi:hypothetical protein
MNRPDIRHALFTKHSAVRGFVALAAPIVVLSALATTFAPVSSLRAATAQAASQCKIVITGAPWHIRGNGSGDKYILAAEGMSCFSVRARVIRYTHEAGAPFDGLMRGPTNELQRPFGFWCHSFRVAASGDNLQYSGVCRHPPHNIPFFEWGPQTKRSAGR